MSSLKVIEPKEDSRVAYMTRYYTEVMIPCHWGTQLSADLSF